MERQVLEVADDNGLEMHHQVPSQRGVIQP